MARKHTYKSNRHRTVTATELELRDALSIAETQIRVMRDQLRKVPGGMRPPEEDRQKFVHKLARLVRQAMPHGRKVDLQCSQCGGCGPWEIHEVMCTYFQVDVGRIPHPRQDDFPTYLDYVAYMEKRGWEPVAPHCKETWERREQERQWRADSRELVK